MKYLSIFLLGYVLFIVNPINGSDFHNNDFPHSTTHHYPTRQTYKYEAMFLSGNANKMKEAVQNHVNPNCSDKYGNTALHLAAYRRDYDQLKPLVNLRVNRYAKNKAGLLCDDILRKNQETGCTDITDDVYFKKVMREETKKIIQNLSTPSNHK